MGVPQMGIFIYLLGEGRNLLSIESSYLVGRHCYGSIKDIIIGYLC